MRRSGINQIIATKIRDWQAKVASEMHRAMGDDCGCQGESEVRLESIRNGEGCASESLQ
jgi:hypothetical protein